MKKIITFTDSQRTLLNKLWFVFGNNGEKHTHNNHRFIQNLLETGEDTRNFYLNADFSRRLNVGQKIENLILTEECINEVDKILNLDNSINK